MRILFFLILFFIPLVALLHPGLPITHDGQDHVARIANFYQSLSEGNIIPRWAGNLNWGYGHPILMFLYPLPSYFASVFHLLGFSFIDSLKIVFGLSFIASGFAMYIFFKEYLGKEAGLAAGVLYAFAPYRFVDLYVRGAIGEHVAFVFPPLVLYFLLKLSKISKNHPKYILGGTFSLAGLVLSHNAISLMFLPVIFLYSVYLIWQSKKRKLLTIYYSAVALFGFGVSSFFWIPAFFEGKYTLRNIVTSNDYTGRFANVKGLIYGPWNYGGTGEFTTQVGIIQLIVVGLSIPLIIYLFKKKDKKWIVTLALLIGFLGNLFIMLPQSKFIWENVTTIQKFQFPWRFLSLTVFLTASLGGILVSYIKKSFQPLTIVIVLVLVLFLNKDYWYANGYLDKPDTFFSGIYNGTTDTGESSPIWSVRFMEKQPKEKIEVISGTTIVREIQRKTIRHSYEVEAINDIQLRENTLYFPGWEVLVDGKRVEIEFQSQKNRGVMTFFVPKGRHFVNIIFTETKLRLISDLVSLASLVFLLSYNMWGIKLWRRFL